MSLISDRFLVWPALACAGLIAPCASSLAQEDLTRPPRLSEETPPPAAAPEQPSSATDIEEIVVVSDQNPWRLPDLGSSWRASQAEETRGRISADMLPLWNPDEEEIPTKNPFAVTDDFRRVGFIEIFRIRFGRR